MKRFIFNNRGVAFRDKGATHQRALLLIPGLGGTMRFWDRAIEAFSHEYRVVSFDHPGMGDSEDPATPSSVTMLADLAVALLDHVAVDRAALVGHSMGGIVAQTIAVAHPQRVSALVLSSTWLRADHYFRKSFEQRRWLLETGGAAIYARAQTLSVLPPQYIADNPRVVEAQEQRAAAAFRDPAVVSERIDALLGFDGSAQLAQIHQPALVVCCEGDTVVPPHMSRVLSQQMRATRQGVERERTAVVEDVSLTGGGHFAPLIISDEFVSAVRAFLDTVIPD